MKGAGSWPDAAQRNGQAIRLECLRLAVSGPYEEEHEAGLRAPEVLARAKSFADFVLGDDDAS